MLKYKSLRAPLEHLKATDEQVAQQIDKLMEQNLRVLNVTDRPTQLDDEVVIDFKGFCGGEPFDGGAAEKYPLTLGSGAFIPGFEEQLVGKNIGDHVDVHVTFPESYPAAALAGREATFRCVIHEIHVKTRYESNDDFARDVGGFDSFAELESAVRARLQAYIDRQADAELKNRLMDQVIAAMDDEITDEQLEKALDAEVRALEAQLGRQGLSLDAYLSFLGKTKEALREEMKPDARKNVLRQQAISEIARLEGIEADEASVAAAITEICRENHMTLEQLQPYCTDEFQASVTRSVIADKVLDCIKSHAAIEVVEKA